jgi:cobaltochelatase CobN
MRLLWFLFAMTLAAAEPPRIAVIGGPQPLWPEVLGEFQRRYPALSAHWEFGIPSEGHEVDLWFAYYPTKEEASGADLLRAKRRLGFPLELEWKQPVEGATSGRASLYLDEGGVENGVRLLVYLYSLLRQEAGPAEAPVAGIRAGLYHPDAPGPFTSYAAYRDWWLGKHPMGSAGAVAIQFASTSLRNRDLAAVDALIRGLEASGSLPVAAFGYPAEVLTPLLSDQGRFQPAVVIALSATTSSPKDQEVYNAWGVPILNGLVTRESRAAWAEGTRGLPPDRLAAHLSLPERAGWIAPSLVATTETSAAGIKTAQPLQEGVASIVNRAQRMMALQRKANADKRLAVIYYNNPAGKGNIGASYLQVFPSLKKILGGLETEGYTLSGKLPSERELRELIEKGGRNLEDWPAGDTHQAEEAKAMTLWPVAKYRRLYDALPASFRRQVEAAWGAPEAATLMTSPCPAGRCFLLPVRVNGNVLLAPQPLRTTFDRASDPGHERTTPPPHQYIAFYLWLREEWKADALLHLGRHGTLEWLPGKQTALAPEDAPVILSADLPNFNVYVMDGGGEAIQAKRRGQATMISHLTPMIWRAGARDDLEKLHQSFHELVDHGETLAPALAAEHEAVTRAEVRRLGLDKQLNIDLAESIKAMAPALHRFLHQIEDAPVPAGLPVFGQSPTEEQLREAVGSYLFSAFAAELHDEVEPLVGTWAAAFLKGESASAEGLRAEVAEGLKSAGKNLPAWIDALRNSGADEMKGLLRALAGRHVPSHLLGDPLRKPEALPTGSNLHAVDSARIPTPAAWKVGQQMARDFLARYEEAHHRPAKRVTLVLWYGETERHQGAMESMALALLGVRPVWNARGIVENLELMSAEELGRQRVDVVFTASGNYRDGFPDKMQLLDRAVRLAATADDGVIALTDRTIAAALAATGMDAGEAKRQSELRVFSAKPGAYGVGVQYLVERSGGADTAAKIAALYTSNMGFGYSQGQWGVASEAALKGNLRTIDAVQFSRSSNLYGSLDNDDTYQYVGGLRTAAEAESGKAPEVLMHNLRREGAAEIGSLRESLAVELHSRQFNPKWIGQMMKSGYAGAREIRKEIEHLYGFQKTTPDHLDSATWQTVMDVFVKDKHGLGLQTFFERENPYARQALLARLIEVDRQGLHRFSPADQRDLIAQYTRSVAENGAVCNALDCGSPVLRSHMRNQLRASGKVDEAKRLDEAYRQMRERARPQPSPESKPEKATYRLSDLRQLGKYVITWVQPKKMADTVLETAKAAPWWVWGALALAYAAAVLSRTRGGTKVEVLRLSKAEAAER